jgi:hypothetical protein
MTEEMTENQIFKKGYLFWAVYASMIPFAILTIAYALVIRGIGIQLSDDLGLLFFLGLWVVSFLISIPFVRSPFLKSFDKYKLAYTDGTLRNFRNSIKLSTKEIEKIFVGHTRRKSMINRVNKTLSPEVEVLNSISASASLTLVLSNHRILFLNLLLLKNGPEVQDRLLKQNADRIQEKLFDVRKYRTKNRLKWYVILDYKE